MNIELLRTLGQVKRYRQGEFVCLEQEPGNTAFLLLKGTADVICGSFEDRCRKVAQLQPGAIFGEMSLLENKARNASVQATAEDTMVLEIERNNFLLTLQADCEIAWNLMRSLLTRMENMMNGISRSGLPSASVYQSSACYLQLKQLNRQQFYKMIEQDVNYVFSLLKFLSSSVAAMNEEMVRQVN